MGDLRSFDLQSSEDLDIKTKDVRRISSVVNSRTNALKFKGKKLTHNILKCVILLIHIKIIIIRRMMMSDAMN